MNITVKNISETKVELTFVLGAEELAVAEQVAVAKLAKNVKIAGFRQGKAPLNVASKNVDPMALYEETLNNAISKAVAEGFMEKEIQALDRPVVDIKKNVPGESLEFTAEVEILPKIKLGDYKKLKVTKSEVVVSEKEVEDVIERIQKGLADKKIVDREAKIGDEVMIDYIGKLDGVAFDGGTGKDYSLVLGSNTFIPGFEDGIVGKKAESTFDLGLTFPADYPSKELKDKKVIFTTTLKEIKELSLPELDDKLATKAGPFKTFAEMKADIERELTDQKKRENEEKIKDDLINQLVKASEIPVPEILLNDQVKSIEQDFMNNLMYQGLSIEQYLENNKFESKEKWLETEVKSVAEKRVKASLALAELSKAEKITATNKELDSHIDIYKQQYSKNTEMLKQFEKPEVRRDIANRLLTEKTIDKLVELNSK